MNDANTKPAVVAERRLPYAALMWLLATLLIFAVGQQTVTLHDQEKFIGDFEFTLEAREGEKRLILNLTAGTFVYGVTPEAILPVPTGRFSRGDETAPQVARALFGTLNSISEITIAAQTITVVYDSDMEAEQIRSRLRRPVNNAVSNNRSTITAEVSQSAEKTIVFSTSDDHFRYAQYQPALVDSIEDYGSRAAAEAGSDLARFIVAESRPVESLRLEPTRLVVGYAEGAALEPLARNLREILNDFHPRASLAPKFVAADVCAGDHSAAAGDRGGTTGNGRAALPFHAADGGGRRRHLLCGARRQEKPADQPDTDRVGIFAVLVHLRA